MSSTMSVNNAGGLSFAVDDMTRLRRFLVLGSEGGTYYVKQSALTVQNCDAITRLLAGPQASAVVDTVVEYSVQGRTAKQDQLVFVLAMAARLAAEPAVRRQAYDALAKVCRIPTTLFQFLSFVKQLAASSGWGRQQRRAVSEWYNDKSTEKLAYQLTKYQQRDGWSHTDVLRLAHTKPASPGHNTVFQYVTKGYEAAEKNIRALAEEEVDEFTLLGGDDDNDTEARDRNTLASKAMRFLIAVEQCKAATEADEVAGLIRGAGLVREHVPTSLLNSVVVWTALMEKMPLTAMIRNLGKMSSLGLFDARAVVRQVTDRLTDRAALKAARVHPFAVLLALRTYAAGRGFKGSLTWKVDHEVRGALDKAFHLAFGNVTPTNKRYCLALDVSGSMMCPIMGTPQMTCREASVAMALVTLATEPHCELMAFSSSFVPLQGIDRTTSIDAALTKASGLRFGGTDCAVPMKWAQEKKKKFDAFVVYTDSETWFGKTTPVAALQSYRAQISPDAKLIVVGMASNGFSIADPNDKGMMDVVGFDAATPEAMSSFVRGEL